MTSVSIESAACAAIISAIAWEQDIEPFIATNDKTPIWDGNIYALPNEQNKLGTIRKVPVQVKGKDNADYINEDHISFSDKVSNLKAYLNDGGIIFFVVGLDRNTRSTAIFYKCLLPYDLNILIPQDSNQETKTFSLNRLPSKDGALYDICVQFLYDRDLQRNQIDLTPDMLQKITSKEETSKIPIGENSHVKFNPFDATQSFYIYSRVGLYSYATGCTDNSDILEPTPVYINSKKYYDYVVIESRNNVKCLRFGKSLKMFLPSDESTETKGHINLNGTLSEQITDSDFILALSEHKHFTIETETDYKLSDYGTVISPKFQKVNEDLKKVKYALDYFGVNTDLDLDMLSNNDYKNISELIEMSSGKDFDSKDALPFFYLRSKIGNISIKIIAEVDNSNHKCKYYSAFQKFRL